MKAIIIAGVCGLLGACSTTSVSQFNDLVAKISADPRCGHIDRIQGNLGGVGAIGGGGLSVYLERTCPAGVGTPAP